MGIGGSFPKTSFVTIIQAEACLDRMFETLRKKMHQQMKAPDSRVWNPLNMDLFRSKKMTNAIFPTPSPELVGATITKISICFFWEK